MKRPENKNTKDSIYVDFAQSVTMVKYCNLHGLSFNIQAPLHTPALLSDSLSVLSKPPLCLSSQKSLASTSTVDFPSTLGEESFGIK